MMTGKRIRTVFTLTAAIVAMLGLAATSVHAEVIYSEIFDGDGTVALDGLAPTEGEGTWASSPLLNNDGTKPDPGHCNAFLPFTPEAGKLYRLSVTFDTVAGDNDWFALAFTENNDATGQFHIVNPPAPWMFNRAIGESYTGSVGTDDLVVVPTADGPIDFMMELDTTSTLWTVEWFVDGVSVRSMTYATNPTINFVGLGLYNQTTGSVDNFLLEIPVPNLASSPSPADGQADVLRDFDLSWTPGIFAAAHNLYVGESFEDVNTATVPTDFGLDVNSLDPGRMDFGQTIFWRVDEVNGTPDKTVFKGDVWSFEVEPYSIQIAGSEIMVTASSASNESSLPEKTLDGSGLGEDGTHAIQTETMWFTAMGDMTPWIQYEFDGVKKLDTMKVWNSNSSAEGFIGYGVQAVLIEYSLDGETWDLFEDVNEFSRAPGLPTYNQYDEIALGGVAAKRVRLTIQSNFGGFMQAYSLSEVQFFMIPAAARTPVPESGSTGVLPDAVVSWRAGREASQSTVTLSTDPNEVADGLAASVTSNTNSLDLGSFDLQLGQTYYWRVDEVNEAEATSVWAGPVWSFSTVAALVVDDFEGYNNDSPDRPFQAWLDGYGYSADEFFPAGYGGNGTGSGIGHDIWTVASPHYDGLIMETGITLPGSGQSMPFYYSNSGAVASETQRSFTTPLDWTIGGVQTLSIAFHGTAGNTGQLYAKINNTKIVYDQDPADIANGAWLVWQIDLSSINGLDNVTQLSIGVDGGGVTGMIYIDDIGLYAEASELITPVAPGTENLVAYYPFDGDILDAAGSHDGTINNGIPAFGPGVQGQGIEFIGNQDVIVAYADDLALNSFTISTWVNVSDFDGNRGILGTRYNGENTFDLKIDANRIHADVGDGTAWLSTAVDLSTPLQTDSWYHIAYVIDEANSAARIYLNGALAETITINGTPLFMKPDQALHIGNSYGVVEYMVGTLDEVSIYKGVLSAAEVASLAGRTMPIYKAF